MTAESVEIASAINCLILNRTKNKAPSSRNSFNSKAWNVLEEGNQIEGCNWDFSTLVWPACLMGGDNRLFLETIKKENFTTEEEWVKIRLSKRFIFNQSLFLTF